jgi:hypothetical protein
MANLITRHGCGGLVVVDAIGITEVEPLLSQLRLSGAHIFVRRSSEGLAKRNEEQSENRSFHRSAIAYVPSDARTE